MAWALGLAMVGRAGTQTDGYAQHVLGVPPPYPYPTEGVIEVGIAITIEVLILLAIMRPSSDQRSWWRLLGALVLLVTVLMSYGVMLMHAPPYHVAHWLWLALVTLVVLITMIASIVAEARAPRERARDPR